MMLHRVNKSERVRRTDGLTGQTGRRMISLLLCLCMSLSILCDFGGWLLSSVAEKLPKETQNILKRVADPDTTDSYIGKLLSTQWGSRYAGRIWTDKSVFAHAPNFMDASDTYSTGSWNGNYLTLDMFTDGYNGQVGFDADFGTVFSALASSQVVNEAVTSPLDLVILLDMSGSMGSDIEKIGQVDIKTLNGNRTQTGNSIVVTPGNSKWTNPWWDVFSATYSSNSGGYVVNSIFRAGSAASTNISVPSNGILIAVHNPEVTCPDCAKVEVGDLLIPNEYMSLNSNTHIVNSVSEGAAFNIFKPHKDLNERIQHSRIYSVLESINDAIDTLMEMNETNRVCVVGYGATAATILPLGHYEKDGDKNYLSVDSFTGYYSNSAVDVNSTASAAYTVHSHAYKVTFDGETTTKSLVNKNIRNNYQSNGTSGATLIGFHTDLQAGIYQGFNELYNNLHTEADVTYTFHSDLTGEDRVVQRIPVAFVMTDGGSNYALKRTDVTSSSGDEWYNVPIAPSVTDYLAAQKKYRSENDGVDRGGNAVMLDILLTASYMKSKIQNKYTELLQGTNLLEEGKKAEFQIHTVSVDTPTTDWQIPRVYAALDPSDFFNANPTKVDGKDIDPSTWAQLADVKQAWNDFTRWQNSSTGITLTFHDSDTGNRTVKFNKLPSGNEVTNEEVVNNILYNTSFEDIGASDLAETFQKLIANFNVPIFSPLSGNNEVGVGNSVTYQDPLGEYMELKNQSVLATSHKDSSESTYDMAMLLFGEMHGLVRAGVYDWQWNDQYMSSHPELGTAGVAAFPMGWYKGDDPKTAEKAALTKSDGSGSYPADYDSAEEAWEDGWVMRLNFATMLQFVPINANIEPSVHPADAPEQIKNTVYTCYRFAGTSKERNELHRNPVYGALPSDLQKNWNENTEYEKSGYPAGMDSYSKYPGVYRLSDIRVWVEHTGDFIDTNGVLTPEANGGYDDSLYLNIPVAALPTQVAEITVSPDGPLSYETNLGQDHCNVKDVKLNANIPEEAYTYFQQSTPIRLFYAVGLTEDLIVRDADGNQTGVDVSKISGEYIATHSDPETNNIWFISNWYSNTPYTGYTSDETDTSRTRGDAAVTFSPSEKNRYYIFQKALPLFAHAYRVQDLEGNLAPVDRADSEEWKDNKSGNGGTTWENGESAATWIGGEFLGTYKDEASFKAALAEAKASESRMITDAKGYSYPLPADDQITNSVITFTEDQLNKVDSDETGKYTEDSLSFSSDDYFLLCVEYYVPTEGVGKDINGKDVDGTSAVRAVTRVIARKGSGFGSGLHSENIGNGDMLCWTDIGGNCTLEIEYNSRTDTGDNTRGRPTFEKLTYDEDDLRTYLQSCGLKDDKYVEVPNGDGTVQKSYLELDVEYWLGVQADPHMKSLIDEIKNEPTDDAQRQKFNELFDWSVAARTGGIRVGDMFQNIQAKGGGGDLIEGYYEGNVTHTANNYYIPTLSETSTAGDGLVIDNYLGNNGRLEIANSTLIVTKTLELPDGYEQLTDEQKNKYFDYQAYIQGVTGVRSAQRLAWNPFSQSWQKRVESLDILTDNSSLLLDTNGNRALFCYASETPRQVVEVVEEGVTKYYYADENGLATADECTEGLENLYYMYLPSGDEHTYHLFGSTYEGGTTELPDAGTTAYYPSGMSGDDMPKGDNDKQTLAEATTGRPAGSRDYWTSVAELIPYTEVREAELPADTILDSEVGLAAESVDLGRWDHETNHGSTENHKSLEKFTLVTVIPDTASTDSTIYSPFNSRTQYMTTDLYFGYKKGLAQHLKEENETFADCKHLSDYTLSVGGLYDQTVPNADRPDLFGNLTNDMIAANTAEFQLKSGEGLLITGLGNRIVYRFTEKLSAEDLSKGYTLKEISHIQQRGSESIYRPGVQKIPVYTKDGAKYGSNYPTQIADELTPNGLTWKDNEGAVESLEPFAHTNAIMWEYYATMAVNSAGNHHQRTGETETAVESADVYKGNDLQYADVDKKETLKHDVLDNPNCATCDEAIKDGEGTITGYLHYMYKDGKPVDYHYNGEASAMLRNMSRYLVSPTVHFGVKNEDQSTVPATVPESGYYDYDGVYSAFGNTGYFAEQVHYTNTISPEMLVLTKQVVDVAGHLVVTPPDQEFTFTLTFEAGSEPAPAMSKTNSTLYYWRGNLADLDKSPEENGPPALDRYTEYTDQTKEHHLELLTPVSDTTYSVHLKANEAIVIYGLVAGTKVTMTEEKSENYPIVDPLEHNIQNDEFLSQYVTVKHNNRETVSMRPSTTENRANFYNRMFNGSLTVEKKILDEDSDIVEQDFTFTVKLDDPTLDTTKLTVTKYAKGDETGTPIESPDWTEVKDADGTTTAWTLTFTLKHGEKVKIDGIPLDTAYTVTESRKGEYNLEHVADNAEDTGEYLEVEYDGVSGTVSAANSEVYLLFANARAPKIPATGGIGLGLFYGLGTLALLVSGAAIVIEGRKRNAR